MFQTEVIHALQSLASAPLTALMVGVTYLGYGASFFVLAVVVVFAVDFRKGYVLASLLMWSAVALYLLKHHVALPRPWAVDRTVKLLGSGAPNLAPFERMGAPGFWDALPEAVVAHYRAQADASQGFPSGHVSTTVAFWGALALLYRRRWLTAAAVVLVLLMSLSRLYLGMHFLADVLGGLLLGVLLLGAAYGLVLRPDRLQRLWAAAPRPHAWPSAAWLGYGVVVPFLLLPLVPAVRIEDAARLLGLNLGLFLVARHGLPVWTDGVLRRAARVLLALALYGAASFVLQQAGDLLFGAETRAWAFCAEAASITLMLWGTVRLMDAKGA